MRCYNLSLFFYHKSIVFTNYCSYCNLDVVRSVKNWEGLIRLPKIKCLSLNWTVVHHSGALQWLAQAGTMPLIIHSMNNKQGPLHNNRVLGIIQLGIAKLNFSKY